jgi:predicted ABC-type ATPase
VLALSLGMEPYAAAQKADAIRRKLVQLRESFIFETVFSDPVGNKLRFLKECEKAGYTVLLIFIGVSAPEISDGRVAMRVAQGGHDVPANKIIERYPRVMNNLRRALVEVTHVHVYDNSDLKRPYRLVAVKEDGQKIELHDPVPAWLHSLLPRS